MLKSLSSSLNTFSASIAIALSFIHIWRFLFSRVLTSLNLAQNHLCGVDRIGQGTYDASGITSLADALRVNASLTSINLSNNSLKDEGIKVVCEALQSNKETTKLASLNMSGNGIGPAGAKAVAAMAAVVASLTRVR